VFFVSVVCCCRSDHSSKGVLPRVNVSLGVIKCNNNSLQLQLSAEKRMESGHIHSEARLPYQQEQRSRFVLNRK
jgi:hypothetical protein